MTSEQQYSTVEVSDIGYCFSPYIVKVNSSSGITGINIQISYSKGVVYNEILQFNEETEIRKDISEIIKAIFNYKGIILPLAYLTTENSSKQFNIVFIVNTKNGNSIHSFQNVTFVYGAVDYLKVYYAQNVNKKIKHFVNFPFGLSFLLDKGAIYYSTVKVEKKYLGEYKNIVFERFNKPNLSTGAKYIVYINNDGVEIKTDRYPFIDVSVVESESQIYTVTVDNCTEGVYLMWLNREGMRSFYLFKNKGVTTTVEGDEYQKPLSYNTAYYIENAKQVNKKAKKVITLAVSMADKEEYSYIESVLTSPEVYMYDNKSELYKERFTKVNVVTGDFERTGAELQDFTFQIELPEEYTVKL